jgi:hypothetical protein
MVNLRGLLARILGVGHASLAAIVAFAACGVAAVALGLAWRRRSGRRDDEPQLALDRR